MIVILVKEKYYSGKIDSTYSDIKYEIKGGTQSIHKCYVSNSVTGCLYNKYNHSR